LLRWNRDGFLKQYALRQTTEGDEEAPEHPGVTRDNKANPDFNRAVSKMKTKKKKKKTNLFMAREKSQKEGGSLLPRGKKQRGPTSGKKISREKGTGEKGFGPTKGMEEKS